MDDYAREMMDLKTLVTRTLEKKGVLAKIRVNLYSFLLSCSSPIFSSEREFLLLVSGKNRKFILRK